MMEDNYDPFQRGQKCADELGINWQPIYKCGKVVEGQKLLAMYGDDTHSLRPKVSFIPTVVVNGRQDGQTDMLKNLTSFVCRKYRVRNLFMYSRYQCLTDQLNLLFGKLK